jgi:glycosyltransferase involved in cell wall biosynthesis
MKNIVFELPFYSPSVGGVVETIKLAQRMKAEVRFQRKSEYKPIIGVPYTIGMPDKTFPKCDVCITYSDNPYTQQLVNLPQVSEVYIYFLSYGMAYDREKANAALISHPKVTTMCSTKKIEKAIKNDGYGVTRVGFALDMDDMYDKGEERENAMAIYYHPMKSKRYSMAVEVADSLFGSNFVDGVYSFGTSEGYDKAKKPIGLVKNYPNACRTDVLNVFNASKLFIMPSVSEGLNLTPIEATLCGCPSIISDGEIGEIFIDGVTCFVAKHDDYFEIMNDAIEMLSDIDVYRVQFADNMREITNKYTWDKLISNFNKLLT